jgi:hypothetical protein
MRENCTRVATELLFVFKAFKLLVSTLTIIAFISRSEISAQKVVFSESFDNSTSLQPWAPYFSSGWFCEGPLNVLQPETGRGNVLRVNFPAGCVGSESGMGNYRISLDSAYRELYLSWEYFIPADFDYGWADGKGGGKFFGGFAGGSMTAIPNIDNTDTDGWASIMMWQNGYYSTYNYFKGSSYTSGGWPNGSRIADLVKGSWRRVTIRMKINDGDQANGLFEVFDNDFLAYQQTNAKMVNAVHPEYLIEHIFLNVFFGGSGPEYLSPISQYMAFDNLVAFYYPRGTSGFRPGPSEMGRVIEVPAATSYHPLPPNRFRPTIYTEGSGTISSHCAFFQPVDHPSVPETSTIVVAGATSIDIDITRFDYDHGLTASGSMQILKIYQGTGTGKVLVSTFQNGFKTDPAKIVIYGNSATIEWQSGQGNHGGFSLNYVTDGTGSGQNFTCNNYVATQGGVPVQVPEAPSPMILKSLSSSTATFEWTDNSDNENWFEIERRGPNNNDLVQVFKINANITQFSDVGLHSDALFVYRIRSYNIISGPSSWSAVTEVKTALPVLIAPSDLELTNLDANHVAFHWTDNSPDESWFEIERHGPNSDTIVLVTKIDPNTTSYTDTTLQFNSEFTFRIRAYSTAKGYSAYSNALQIQTAEIPIPKAPTKLQSKQYTSESITIRWDDNSSDENKFVITRSLVNDPGKSITIEVNANDTTYTDTGLEPSKTYIYAVKAVNVAGSSSFSNSSVAGTLSVAENKRIKKNLVAYYNFNYVPGNCIHDLSGFGEPLNLNILQPGSIDWNEKKKLEILSNAEIVSSMPARKVANAIRKTGEITVECWIRPDEPTLSGISRIISLGIDNAEIGFVLDQHYQVQNEDKALSYSVRMQTASTTESCYPEIIQNSFCNYINMHHIAYVRDSIGNEALFINGRKTAQSFRPNNFNTWSDDFFLRFGNEKDQSCGWQGTLYAVAIYNRALTLNEININYTAQAGDSINNDVYDVQVNVYPNPVNDKATIEIIPLNVQDYAPSTVVKILNTSGITLSSEVIFNPNELYIKTMDFKNYSPGTYFLQLTSGKNPKTIKLIIQ